MKSSIKIALPPGQQWVMLLGLAISAVAVGSVPTSVLTNVKEANARHGGLDASQSQQSQQSRSSATSNPSEVKNQISVPQKRGVNPLLYTDFDYSGNSIPHGGMWDDLNAMPSSSSAFGRAPLTAAATLFPDQLPDNRMRNYDLLASLLGPPPPPTQGFYSDPVTPSVSFPYVFGRHGFGDRSKRMASSTIERNPLRSLRLKRSPSKLTAADALSLLALLDSRDPYPSMSDYFPLVPANGPNDVLPYPPNSVYQEIPLSLALAQLGEASRNTARLAPYSDDEGEWMNTWTQPAVDYLGFPTDVDTLSRLENLDTKPTKNGFSHQKRFMITKKKRSVSLDDDDDCKNDGKKTCLLRKYSQLAATKVAPA
ncbi:uncharacterized protein LOC5578593 [Aedes aegypti]|uniref:Uncharacterized protein n=2 Tax=Aedes aegypti TaxID=7159 RepID=A0A6I8TQT6_AEDAE|nr:uncharacterized protein LOC5578593 [Aedes aegypti]XP_021700850.1 uncharacterized protein LOC5578593 [Aedes aegypti]